MDSETSTEVEPNEEAKFPTSEPNTVKFGLEIEDPVAKETDTLLSGAAKFTRFGLPRCEIKAQVNLLSWCGVVVGIGTIMC